MHITNLAEANDYLAGFYVNSSEDYSLDTMLKLMDYLENPQEKFKTVHVAGTSGKTSTVYYISALLAASGKKIGLTISPHVDQLNERVQINNVPLPENEFCKALNEFAGLIENSGIKPSWFEAMVAFAYWYFAEAGMDYVVVEVGLGGLLDGTNVIKRPDKVCVITDIGLDHIQILGNTLAEIAAQKIGIAHRGNEVFTYKQADEIMSVFVHYANTVGAAMHALELSPTENTSMPAFQYKNWSLALAVFEFIKQRDDLPHTTTSSILATRDIRIPGRMEIVRKSGKTLIMDGAHNFQKMSAFISGFRQLYPDGTPAILMSLKEDKEFDQLIPLLKSLQPRVILTSFESRQDMPFESMDINKLGIAFKEAGIDTTVIENQHEAYKALIDGDEVICLITGSFYLLSQIRKNEKLA